MMAVDAHTHRSPVEEVLAVVNLHKDSVEVPATGFFSAGIHPWFIHPQWEEDLLWLTSKLEHPSVVAVGECGLDRLAKTPWNLQIKVFEEQLRLAETFAKPLIIHNVRSGSDLLHLRKQSGYRQRWLMHGFHGSLREAEQMVEHGCFLGFGKHLMKPGSKARAACKAVPMDNLLPETDDSGLPVQEVIMAIAQTKELEYEEVKAHLYQNFILFFQLKNFPKNRGNL